MFFENFVVKMSLLDATSHDYMRDYMTVTVVVFPSAESNRQQRYQILRKKAKRTTSLMQVALKPDLMWRYDEVSGKASQSYSSPRGQLGTILKQVARQGLRTRSPTSRKNDELCFLDGRKGGRFADHCTSNGTGGSPMNSERSSPTSAAQIETILNQSSRALIKFCQT